VASEGEPSLAERWMRSRLAEATERATRQLDDLELSAYAASAHEFAWTDLLRLVPGDGQGRPASSGRRPDGEKSRAWRTARDGLAAILQLLHPIMPFVTERDLGARRGRGRRRRGATQAHHQRSVARCRIRVTWQRNPR
jgi:valyl-tRNA synthetase